MGGEGATASDRLLRHAFMKLTREFDSRFESLLLTGRVAKWYSEVGNEATTVPAGLALEAGDVLATLHRDLGAILGAYLDPARTFPELEGVRRFHARVASNALGIVSREIEHEAESLPALYARIAALLGPVVDRRGHFRQCQRPRLEHCREPDGFQATPEYRSGLFPHRRRLVVVAELRPE